jgi:uncharacterized protein (DUF4415 family)
MTGNKPSTAAGWIDPDDAPDLSTPEYQAKLAATPVRRGRPKSESPKVRVGFRLSPDVVASIKASGPGYNARIEQALRAAGFGEPHEDKAPGRVARVRKVVLGKGQVVKAMGLLPEVSEKTTKRSYRRSGVVAGGTLLEPEKTRGRGRTEKAAETAGKVEPGTQAQPKRGRTSGGAAHRS